MRQLGIWLLMVGLVFAGSGPVLARYSALGRSNLDAALILNKIDDLYRGESSTGQLSMTVVTEHWRRVLELEFFNKGKDKALMRILSPKKERGVTTLRVGKDMWNYLPKINRVMKVPVSMMGGEWMGSHFTNDDLVRQSRMAEDFTFEVNFRGKKDDQDVLEIICIAKADAVVVWGKVVLEVEPNTHLPIEIRYYDEDLNLARTLNFGEIKIFGKRKIPTLMKIVPADSPYEFTEVRYSNLVFDADLKDSYFTRHNLER